MTLEAGVVCGLAWWGYNAGGGGWLGIVLAVLAPGVGFGIWGAVDFHGTGKYAEPLRLLEELVISGLAAFGLMAVGQPGWGWALLALSVIYHSSVYVVGERLLGFRTRSAHPHTISEGAASRDHGPTG